MHDAAHPPEPSLGRFADRLAAAVARLPEPRPPSLQPLAAAETARSKIAEWLGRNTPDTIPKLFQPSQIAKRFSPHQAKRLAAALAHAFARDGVELAAPEIGWTGTKAGKSAADWLDGLGEGVDAAVSVLINRPLPTATLLHLEWRRVARPDRCREIGQKLKTWHRVAIVGMSGTGKTFLAREYFDQHAAAGPKRWFDAPKPAGPRSLTPDAFFDLATELFDWLAAQVGGPHGSIDDARKRFSALAAGIAARIGVEERAANAASVAREMRDAIDAARNAKAVAQIAGRYVRRTWRLDSIVEVIAILLDMLPRGPDGTIVYTIVIDDAWSLREARRLIDALAPREPQYRWPLRLLITSQQRDAALSGVADDEKLRPRSVLLDDDETDKRGFALDLIAAWGAPGRDDLLPAEARTRIAGFKAKLREAEQKGDPEFSAIESVIGRLQYHPLAMAAIASAWREGKLAWADFAAAIEGDDPIHWDFDEARELNEAHRNVVWALWRVVDLALDRADRERYLDLAIQRRGRGGLDTALFDYLWRRRRRAGELFMLTGAGNPIRHKFAPLTLVQQDGAGYVLHDMHRLAISALLREQGWNAVAERHRDLLSAAGLLDDADKLTIDDAENYKPDAALRDIPASERQRLNLKLRQPSDDERKYLSSYFLDELHHHVKAVMRLPGLDRTEWQLLTSLSFLQAQLDRVD